MSLYAPFPHSSLVFTHNCHLGSPAEDQSVNKNIQVTDAEVGADEAYGAPARSERRLNELGYKSEFRRDMSLFGVLGISFCAIGILTGMSSAFQTGLFSGGPLGLFWGWNVGLPQPLGASPDAYTGSLFPRYAASSCFSLRSHWRRSAVRCECDMHADESEPF